VTGRGVRARNCLWICDTHLSIYLSYMHDHLYLQYRLSELAEPYYLFEQQGGLAVSTRCALTIACVALICSQPWFPDLETHTRAITAAPN